MHKTKTIPAHELYPDSGKTRYLAAIDEYRKYFESNGGAIRIFSVPGRAEICGNHTDHNHGKVLAAGINLDTIAVIEPIDVNKAVIKCENQPETGVWFDDLSVNENEKNTPSALVRGILKGFCDNGFKIGGFKAYITSNIKSAGLACDASYEMLLCTVISCMFNEGKVPPQKLAQITDKAEQKYYGVNLNSFTDKLACIMGSFISIDYKDAESPIVEKVDVDFNKFNHTLCIIDTGMTSSDLTSECSAISAEMKNVAGFFDVEHLRQVAKQDITLNIDALREEFGDRAILRSLHFFDENHRVDKLVHALRTGEFSHFLDYIKESGNSSYKYLQNVFSCFDSQHESVSLGLYFTETALGGKGACRVHGEGFTGTIEVFVPNEMLKAVKLNIERIFGADSCHALGVRKYGGVEVDYSLLTSEEVP